MITSWPAAAFSLRRTLARSGGNGSMIERVFVGP